MYIFIYIERDSHIHIIMYIDIQIHIWGAIWGSPRRNEKAKSGTVRRRTVRCDTVRSLTENQSILKTMFCSISAGTNPLTGDPFFVFVGISGPMC